MTQCERTIIYLGAMTSFEGVKKLKRTCVHAMLRASLCTSSDNLHQGEGSPGAFAPAGVRARKLWGFV